MQKQQITTYFENWRATNSAIMLPAKKHSQKSDTEKKKNKTKSKNAPQKNKNKIKQENINKQSLWFLGSHPSKYWTSPTLLNFSDQTRTGVFSVV